MTPDARAFQVDLHGVVDLLARHLYSGPRVYLRELMQNAVDAITARRALDPAAPATIRLRPLPGGALTVTDSGIGLTAADAAELLATVGRSSKRDQLGLARDEFLGQFGIGLLSAFMVADTIEMVSRSALDPTAVPVLWRGHADGSYELSERPDLDVAPGSTVWLRARPGSEHWLAAETVTALAREYGELLPADLAVETQLGDGLGLGPDAGPAAAAGPRVAAGSSADVVPAGLGAGAAPAVADEPDTRWEGAAAAAQASSSGEVRPGFAWRRISELELPWRRAYPDSAARARALARYAERVLGFTPLATIDIDVPLAGVSGVAFVLPSAVAPGGGGAHRVYVKRMLVGTRVAGLLPDWAFFVRCVIDGSLLRPTASREQLYDDDVLLATREAITRTVRDWLLRTLQAGGMTAKEFVQAHHLAIRSLALTDDEMLDVALDVLPFETTAGPATLREVEHEHGVVVYAPLLEQFRRIAPVARARGLAVVNGGYVYDSDLLGRLAQRHPDRFRTLTAADLAQVFAVPTPERELATLDAVDRAREVLAPLECEPQLRVFEPDTVPTVLLTDRDGEYQRELQRTVEESDDVWSEVLAGFARPAAPRRLMFNDACPLVRELLEAPVGEVMDAGVRALYVSAIQLSGEPLRPRDAALMTEAMTVLLRQGLAASRSRRPGDGSATGPGADGR